MSHSELSQLTRAEELYEAGELDEALKLLDNMIQEEENNFQRKGYYQFLKGRILCDQGKYEEALKFGEIMFRENQILKQYLRSVDGLIFMLYGLMDLERFEEIDDIIEKAEDLLKKISNTPQIELLHRKARIYLAKGYNNFKKGNSKLAKNCYNWIINLQNELGNSIEMVHVHLQMAGCIYIVKGEFDKALEHFNKALSIAKGMRFKHLWIAGCHLGFGVVYSHMGEFELCLEHYMKGLKIFEQIQNKWYYSGLLNNIGHTYGIIGKFDLALEYLEESLQLWEKSPVQLVNCLSNLISISIIKGDVDRAEKYFKRLENFINQKQDEYFARVYHYCKALMLKSSSRIRDKAKVEELLKKIIKTTTSGQFPRLNALVHLCDLLLSEFRLTNNFEVLDEVNHYIIQLLTMAEKSHSYLIFCETFILQAKLALINLDVKAARHYLTKAQKIAEKYGIRRLAIKISHEHDELLKQLKMWENLEESKISFSERMKLARLNEQMEHMIAKRKIEVPELLDEEPVLLLIVSEGGMPFFSQSFIEDKTFEDHLFGGFFTAINAFINEKFSEGLERASFGDHTLLMNSVSPFLMCYIYKGQSYSAQNRIKLFINEMTSNKDLWETIEKFYQMNKKIKLNDIPSLEPLITKIFIEKVNL
ncbi:MAG: tetratricopeptide repeat protein [Candidatus Hermodarchaeota archaeon]